MAVPSHLLDYEFSFIELSTEIIEKVRRKLPYQSTTYYTGMFISHTYYVLFGGSIDVLSFGCSLKKDIDELWGLARVSSAVRCTSVCAKHEISSSWRKISVVSHPRTSWTSATPTFTLQEASPRGTGVGEKFTGSCDTLCEIVDGSQMIAYFVQRYTTDLIHATIRIEILMASLWKMTKDSDNVT